MHENPTGTAKKPVNVGDNGITGGLPSERDRARSENARCKFARYRTYVNHARQSRTKIGAALKGVRRGARERRGWFADFFIPLKIQPGILLGADLNNVVDDERMAKKARALHSPFTV